MNKNNQVLFEVAMIGLWLQTRIRKQAVETNSN
jgi:hypothetical protein